MRVRQGCPSASMRLVMHRRLRALENDFDYIGFDLQEETKMKKVFIFVLMAAAVLAAMACLAGCSDWGLVRYADSEKYSVGDAEIADRIENIEIDWFSGSVNVVTHSESTVLLSEETEEGIPEELRVHWWLEGATLHVRFAASGAGLRELNVWHKELTLTVPESLALDDVEIRTASAEIDAAGFTAGTLSISTASGNVSADCAADTFTLKSASGNIRLTQRESAGKVSIGTASGRIEAKLSQTDTACFESTSGRIEVTAALVDSLSVKSNSGAVFCGLEAVPAECKLHAVSGGIELSLPADSDFTATVSTTSGSFDSDFAMKKNGRDYICGSGSADIDIDTTSGSISIRQS